VIRPLRPYIIVRRRRRVCPDKQSAYNRDGSDVARNGSRTGRSFDIEVVTDRDGMSAFDTVSASAFGIPKEIAGQLSSESVSQTKRFIRESAE